MARKVSSNWFIFGLALFALLYLITRSAEALEALQQNSANNDSTVVEKSIPFLNRFKLKDRMDAAGFDDEERKSIYQSYKDGRAGEEQYAKFYSPSEKLLAGQSWKRLSYAVYEKPGQNLHIDVNPKNHGVMLNYSLKMDGFKLDGLKW